MLVNEELPKGKIVDGELIFKRPNGSIVVFSTIESRKAKQEIKDKAMSDFFAQCIICDQGFMDFDQLDSDMVCDQDKCQSKKRRIIDMVITVCKDCGIKFLYDKDTYEEEVCKHCE